METKAKMRDANLDMLRIFAMFLIVLLHSVDHSGVLEAAQDGPAIMYGYVQYIYALTQVCVNCYVLLSGYYLARTEFRIHKLVKLWMETVFYSLLIKALFMACGRTPFSAVALVNCFFPILTGRYWFVTIYVGMYLLSPFLNLAINAMNKRQFTLLNVVLFGLLSAWISIHPSIAGMNSGSGWGLTWFVTLYLLAAWFRLYYQPTYRVKLKLAVFFLIPALVSFGRVVTRSLGGIGGVLSGILGNWYRYDSVPVYFATVSLFVAMLNVRIEDKKMNRWITSAAPLTFGVYLIHAHADLSHWFWETVNLPHHMNTAWFPLIQFGCCMFIFVFCIAVDAIRRTTIGRLENTDTLRRFCDSISDRILGRL